MWISKATRAQAHARARASMLRYTYIARLVLSVVRIREILSFHLDNIPARLRDYVVLLCPLKQIQGQLSHDCIPAQPFQLTTH